MHKAQERPQEAYKCFKRAREIFGPIPEYAELVQELDRNIESIEG